MTRRTTMFMSLNPAVVAERQSASGPYPSEATAGSTDTRKMEVTAGDDLRPFAHAGMD